MISGHIPGEALCRDCGVDLDPGVDGRAEYFYLVKDRVWQRAGMSVRRTSFLCVGCLENRLGRELAGEDFQLGEAANWPHPADSGRLATRKALIVRPAGADFDADLRAGTARAFAREWAPDPALTKARPVPARKRKKVAESRRRARRR